MGLTANVDITKFLNKLEDGVDVIIQEAKTFVEQATEVGAEAARVRLDTAITPYGEFRFGVKNQGRSAGRNDSGTMMDSLKAQQPEFTDTTVSASFGWATEDYQEYFGYQENGTSRIDDAHSLLDGAMAVQAQAPRLAANMRQRISRKMNK